MTNKFMSLIAIASFSVAGLTAVAQNPVHQISPCKFTQGETEPYCDSATATPNTYTVTEFPATALYPRYQIGVLGDYNLSNVGIKANPGGPVLTKNVGNGEYKNFGLGFYADSQLTQHFGVEAEGRMNHAQIYQDSAAIGPRVTFAYGRFQPYVKLLGGASIFSGRSGSVPNRNTGVHYLAATGAGSDFLVSKHLSLRAEAEYQVLFDYSGKGAENTQTIQPLQFSAGLAYRF